MIESVGELWEYPASVRVITTNGHTNKAGNLVMGRGCAKEAAERFPMLAYYLGQVVARKGNRTSIVSPKMLAGLSGDTSAAIPYWLVTFPVKNHWRDKADLKLIARSAEELVGHANEFDWSGIVLPRPGCGNGRLQWATVRLILEPLLDDRFTVLRREDG